MHLDALLQWGGCLFNGDSSFALQILGGGVSRASVCVCMCVSRFSVSPITGLISYFPRLHRLSALRHCLKKRKQPAALASSISEENFLSSGGSTRLCATHSLELFSFSPHVVFPETHTHTHTLQSAYGLTSLLSPPAAAALILPASSFLCNPHTGSGPLRLRCARFIEPG